MKLISAIRHMFRVRRQRVYCLDTPDDIVTVESALPVSFSEITPTNVERVSDFRDEKYICLFRRFLEQGQQGVYAWLDSMVVGHAWAFVTGDQKQNAMGYFELQPNQAFIHYCHVNESYRGQRVYPAMLTVLCHNLFDSADIEKIFIDTESDNLPSIQGIGKVGFRPLGVYLFVQLRNRLIYKREISRDL